MPCFYSLARFFHSSQVNCTSALCIDVIVYTLAHFSVGCKQKSPGGKPEQLFKVSSSALRLGQAAAGWSAPAQARAGCPLERRIGGLLGSGANLRIGNLPNSSRDSAGAVDAGPSGR